MRENHDTTGRLQNPVYLPQDGIQIEHGAQGAGEQDRVDLRIGNRHRLPSAGDRLERELMTRRRHGKADGARIDTEQPVDQLTVSPHIPAV